MTYIVSSGALNSTHSLTQLISRQWITFLAHSTTPTVKMRKVIIGGVEKNTVKLSAHWNEEETKQFQNSLETARFNVRTLSRIFE